MSAIAGIINMNKENSIQSEHSNVMMEALKKYPADDRQTWDKENVFLGCHAQWITPESVGEKLPYYDQDRKLAITADAIIDNRNELFEMLQVSKALRENMPDSKIILLAYERWGEDCPKYLVGDFAFMIWDERHKKLFGARDFSGTRTLYYHNTVNQQFVFCTTIHPIVSLPYFKKELNEGWIAEFLSIPGATETTDNFSTIYQNVYQIPPSHSITILEERITFSKYCNVTDVKQKIKFKSEDEYIEAFQDVFQRSVNDRLRTRHKVGAQLSGGLDSGSVCGVAARTLKEKNERLTTFSYVPLDDFEDWTPKSRKANESSLIKSTVDFVGNIDAGFYDFPEKNPIQDIESWLMMRDTPYKAFINSFWVQGIYEEAKKKGIGVLLKGSRGNFTISYGSPFDYYSKLFKKLKWIKFTQEVNRYYSNTGMGRKAILSEVKKRVMVPKSAYYEFPKIINSEFAKKMGVFEKIEQEGILIKDTPYKDFAKARIQQFEQPFIWNLNGVNGTSLSLKYSLWERDPTNDIRLIKFCLALPEEQYVQKGFGRALIRRASKGLLPDDIRLNQTVRGVQGADIIHRMKNDWDGLITELNDTLNNPYISQYLDISYFHGVIEKFKSGPKPHYVFDPHFKNAMRIIILSRFINSSFEGR